VPVDLRRWLSISALRFANGPTDQPVAYFPTAQQLGDRFEIGAVIMGVQRLRTAQDDCHLVVGYRERLRL
jgi:hypothetical protein